MGPQKRLYNLGDLDDTELSSVADELVKFWQTKKPDYSFESEIRCNTPESTYIFIRCIGLIDSTVKESCDTFIRIEPKGEWLEKQNMYVKFTIDE